MSKHTPGPWFSERDQVGPRSQKDDQSFGMLMPVAYIELYDHPEKAEANKALIAAAPELLTLLEESRRTFEMWKDVAPAVSLCADIDSAIAKAKGEAK